MSEAPKVYAAIAAVMGDLSVEGVGKGRRNQQQGYNFRGIDDMYNALSPVLAKHKLVMLPRILTRNVTERQTQKGGALFYVVVEAEFDLICADDGSTHTIRTFGEAMDSADKATNKAMSAAYKYAAMQAFAIPTEGDNDADAQTHEVAAEPKPASKAESRDVYERLRAANKKLASRAEFDAFWAKDSVRAAFSSLPADEKKNLAQERDDKAAEIAEREAIANESDPFGFDRLGKEMRE